jgi:hypothetical protein
MTDASAPQVTAPDACACVRPDCAHPGGKCPQKPVVVKLEPGTSSPFCKQCAERLGFVRRDW